MKVFIKEQVLPFLLVCVTVVGLTVTCYGLPRSPPPKALALGGRFSPVQNQQREDALVRAIDVLRGARSQAEATLPPRTKPAAKVAGSPLSQGRNPGALAQAPGASPIAMGGSMAPAAAMGPTGMGTDPSMEEPPTAATITPVMAAVTSLSEAVKSIRSARTEEDFMRAEEQMRTVRTQMQAACTSGASSAFCDSAKEIGSLGF